MAGLQQRALGSDCMGSLLQCMYAEKACREYASQCVCMRYPNCLKPSAQQQRHFGQSCDTTKYDRAAHEYNHDEACRCNSAFCSKGHGCTLPSTTPQTCHKRQCPYDAMLLIQIKNLAASTIHFGNSSQPALHTGNPSLACLQD